MTWDALNGRELAFGPKLDVSTANIGRSLGTSGTGSSPLFSPATDKFHLTHTFTFAFCTGLRQLPAWPYGGGGSSAAGKRTIYGVRLVPTEAPNIQGELMKLIAVASLAMVASVIALMLMSQKTAAAPQPGERIPGQYIVVFVDGVNPTALADEMAGEHGLGLLHIYSHALNGFAARVPEGRLQALEHDPRVAYVEADRVVSIAHHCKGAHRVEQSCNQDPTPEPNPEPTPSPEPTPDPIPSGQIIPTGVLRINGDQSSTTAGSGSGRVDVDVAVIDSGIDTNHPDLNVVGGRNCVYVSKKRDEVKYDDGYGHGTHVAGTVGALDNDFGVVGVAPGARLWAVRVLNDYGSGSLSGLLCGVDWVKGQADTIEVANMSLSAGCSPNACGDTELALHQAIRASVSAGITFVVAAGNSRADAAGYIPAAYDEVITVSALADFDGKPGSLKDESVSFSRCTEDKDDSFACFSNYGDPIDIIAPGLSILSTWNDGGYNTKSGTSMASPHVAGAAALYLANNLGKSPDLVKAALISAGNPGWSANDDPDNTKEPLVDASGF